MERAEIIPNQPMEFSQQLPTPFHEWSTSEPIKCTSSADISEGFVVASPHPILSTFIRRNKSLSDGM